jgi:hypothetical protein
LLQARRWRAVTDRSEQPFNPVARVPGLGRGLLVSGSGTSCLHERKRQVAHCGYRLPPWSHRRVETLDLGYLPHPNVPSRCYARRVDFTHIRCSSLIFSGTIFTITLVRIEVNRTEVPSWLSK